MPVQPHPPEPEEGALKALRQAAEGCRACPLFQDATLTVFGEGTVQARLFLVGDQPGPQDDRAGRPFRGPAGKLLSSLLEECGIPRTDTYLTNAVKHYKFAFQGTRRVDRPPSGPEVRACLPWLEAELEAVKPEVLVLLGGVAARALLGLDFEVSEQRGHLLATPWCEQTLATIHPSLVLRQRSEEYREQARLDLLSDLRQVAALLRPH